MGFLRDWRRADHERALTVSGEEHYLESLRDFACFAHPITHPVTGRLVRVLDVTGLTQESGALMAPLAIRAIRDIEDRLLMGSTNSHQRMLSALHARSARSRGPVLVVAEDLTLSNAAAGQLIGDEARHSLRQQLADLAGGRSTTLDLPHPSGQSLRVLLTPVEGAPGAHLCEVVLAEPERAPVPRGANALADTFTMLERRTPQPPRRGDCRSRVDEGSTAGPGGDRGRLPSRRCHGRGQ